MHIELMVIHIYTTLKRIKNFKLVSLFLLVLAINSCSSVNGVYTFFDKHSNSKELSLSNDSKFILISEIYPYKDTILGKWRQVIDTIYLTPNNIPNYINHKTRVIESIKRESDSIEIKVILNDSISKLSEVFLNNTNHSLMTDNRGVLKLPKDTKINYFVAGSLGFPFYRYRVINPSANNFKVYIYDWLREPRWTYYNFNYKYLKKNNRLYPFDENTGSIKDYFLKKQR